MLNKHLFSWERKEQLFVSQLNVILVGCIVLSLLEKNLRKTWLFDTMIRRLRNGLLAYRQYAPKTQQADDRCHRSFLHHWGKCMRKLIVLTLSATLSLLLFVPHVSATSYRWVDKNGEIRVTDYPPPTGKSRAGDNKSRTVTKKRYATAQQQVELFITSWCPYCKQAAEFFRSRGISFKSYDIEKNKSAAQRKKKLDPRSGVPFAVVNGHYIHGYAPEKYQKALK